MDYYNEIDPYCVEWLGNLMDAGVIGRGEIDTRSIEDVTPNDLRGFTQCHFFAGIGVWSYALRQAGWPVDRPVWTGSCPCQPFSASGKRGGFDDERHLWPAWLWLIRGSRPDNVFGEQVASKDGLAWLDLVSDDMAGEKYAFAPMDICAASVGAPNIRQRIYFASVAHAYDAGLERWIEPGSTGFIERLAGKRSLVNRMALTPREFHNRIGNGGAIGRPEYSNGGDARGLANANAGRWGWKQDGSGGIGDGTETERDQGDGRVEPGSQFGGVADSSGFRREPAEGYETVDVAATGVQGSTRQQWVRDELSANVFVSGNGRPSPVNGFWRDSDWIFCRDNSWRPIEPGSFPLAHGAPGRVGRLRAYGNAINAEVAIEHISAFLECEADGFVDSD